MTQWVVFIPRPQQLADTKDVDQNPGLVDQAKTWITHTNKLTQQNIVTAGNQLPATLMTSPDTRLYIMGGHCKEGRNFLTWPGESNPLCCHQLGDELAAAGLPQTFTGHIKAYSCLSADHSGSSVSFAKRFGEYMRYLGFSCTIWGYTGAVSKGYINSGTPGAPIGGVAKIKFKKSDELGQGYHKYATAPGGYGPRAKDAKRDVTAKPTATITLTHCNICNRF